MDNIEKYKYQSMAIHIPEPVAYIHLANTTIAIYEREEIPNAFHRLMLKLVFGIRFELVKDESS